MGEAKLRRLAGHYWTLDVFDPLGVMLADRPDETHVAAVAEAARRHFQSPTPICSCCGEYEFPLGAAPARLFILKPMFPRTRPFQFIGGSICEACAARDRSTIEACLTAYLRETNPNLERVQQGRA